MRRKPSHWAGHPQLPAEPRRCALLSEHRLRLRRGPAQPLLGCLSGLPPGVARCGPVWCEDGCRRWALTAAPPAPPLAVKIMLEEAARRSGAHLVEGAVRFPLPEDGAGALVQLVADTLPPTARLAGARCALRPRPARLFTRSFTRSAPAPPH